MCDYLHYDNELYKQPSFVPQEQLLICDFFLNLHSLSKTNAYM